MKTFVACNLKLLGSQTQLEKPTHRIYNVRWFQKQIKQANKR